MSTAPSDDNDDSLIRAQTQYERKLARQKKLADMDRFAKGVEDLLTDESTSNFLSMLEEASHSSKSSSRSSGSSNRSIPSGMHAPPEGAVETARKFLWDEDDDDVSLPPSRGFDGQLHNVEENEEFKDENSDASSSDKKPRAGIVRGVMSRISKNYTPVNTNDNRNQQVNLAPGGQQRVNSCTEIGADASSTISSYEESDQGMVRIELGDPADIGNRPRPPPRRVICGKCRSIMDGFFIMCRACLSCTVGRCCNMSRRCKTLCFCTFLLLPLLILGSLALVKYVPFPFNGTNASESGSTPSLNETDTLAPTNETFERTDPPIIETPQEFTEAPIPINETSPESTETPVLVNETSPEGTEAPVALNETSSESTEAPVEATESPVTESPNESTEAPDTETPTEGTEAPVNESPSQSTEPPVSEPPQEGTPPYNIARYDAIRTAIVESSLTTDKQLKTLGTVQNKALLWLTDFDKSNIEPDHEALLQRYALATLFFSTSSTLVTGYTTLAEEMVAVLTDPQLEWDRGQNWMTEKGICEWQGVHCSPSIKDEEQVDENADVIHLNLTSNNLRGTIPLEIAALQQLKTLNLSSNVLHGPIPTSIGAMKALDELYLTGNDITGKIPTELAKCTSLIKLHLGNNHLEGPIPTHISALKELRDLVIDENKLTGTLPDVTALQHLQNLTLSKNFFVGSLPTEYGKIATLTDLRISDNELEGTIPTELSLISRLEYLHMSGNNFFSTLPDMFERLPYLRELQLQENKLSGPMPKSIGSLKALRELNLDWNYFTGTIHKVYGTLSQLHSLYLSNNKLGGFIPEDIEGWKANLTDFRANHNALTGPIPTAFGSIYKLEILHLNDNFLLGTIPTSLGALNHLRSFRFYNNHFKGTVPEDICNLVEHHQLELLAADCSSVSGTIECRCCQECHL